MKLARAPERYDVQDQAQLRATVERADLENIKRGRDIELVRERLILRSPNGTRYVVTVSDTGTLSAVAL